MEMEPPSQDLPVSILDEGASNHGSQDHWSYLIETKSSESVQLAFQNINGLSHTKDLGDMKLNILQQWIHQNKDAVFMCTELGILLGLD